MVAKTTPARHHEAVTQFSVFTPNRLGRLHDLVGMLASHGVHVLALTLLGGRGFFPRFSPRIFHRAISSSSRVHGPQRFLVDSHSFGFSLEASSMNHRICAPWVLFRALCRRQPGRGRFRISSASLL